MKRTLASALQLIAAILFLLQIVQAQVATGTPPFSSLGGGPFDVINLGNLNVHFSIPVIHKAGRGMDFTYDLSYDSSIWTPVTANGTATWQPQANWGWKAITEAGLGFVTYKTTSTTVNNCTTTTYSGYVYHDSFGISHTFSGSAVLHFSPLHVCAGFTGLTSTTNDGSGYTLNVINSGGNGYVTARSGAKITPPFGLGTGSGAKTDANGNQITSDSSGNFYDTLYTNQKPVLTVTGSGTPSSPMKYAYIPPSGASTSSASALVTVSYVNYTVKTNFGAKTPGGANIGEYSSTSAIPLVDNIQLPDGSKYSFAYEATTGSCTLVSGTSQCVTARILSVTLPTGGTITYGYSGGYNGIENDGSTAGLTRTLSATGNSPGGTWSYTRTPDPSMASHWTTTVTTPPDPINQNCGANCGDNIVVDFQQDSNTNPSTYNFYETQKKVYQGLQSGGTLLITTQTCYNASGCGTTVAVSSYISAMQQYTIYPSGLESEHNFVYDSTRYGLRQTINEFAFGVGAPGARLRQTNTTYGSWNGTSCVALNNGINSVPCQVKITDYSTGTGVLASSTSYTYDEGTPQAPTGITPQHTSISGSRGNLTTIATQASSSVTLYRHFTYYDTGNVQTATDAGLANSGGTNTTAYSYPDATSTCGNAFSTSANEPLSFTRSFTWDCSGGVQTSMTDENGQTSTVYYAQTSSYGSADTSYWRPYAATDPLNYATTFIYPSVTASESTFIFNNNHSVVDRRATLDGFGRPIVSQAEQGYQSANYDSTEVDYDAMGRPATSYMPYVAGASSLCSGNSCHVTATTYDVLNRPTHVQDAGGGTVSYVYSQNDVLQTIGPLASGENLKKKQLEYDALGRLTSVCEITSGTYSGPCNQTTTGQTGFWTQYSYNALNKLTSVTQNSQTSTMGSQSRSYSYDMIGRLTSEMNPETGSIIYVYDSWDSACGTYSSPGDLVEKKDAVGNITCLKYNSWHQVSQITYPAAGPYASRTPTKCFVYGAATVNGTAMSYPNTRLAEAYTTSATSCPGTPSVDEGFSYTKRGELADVWEKTLNSGGYYHVNAAYWPTGTLNVLNGGTNPLPGLPAITYGASDSTGGLDGEGRVTEVTTSSGQNPLVNSVSYNTSSTSQPIGALTSTVFGSTTQGTGDSDSYTYDVNTDRMTGYTLSMGTAFLTQIGTLTWNPNGTLQQLKVTDQINNANGQTCNFAYDDLARLVSANCGPSWAQTFGFDPFGNLNKSGTASFVPIYTGAPNTSTSPTNQYYQLSGGPSGTSNYYDANGNLTSDSVSGTGHTYTWDADGNMVAVDTTLANCGSSGICLTYDALDRMVEQQRTTGYQQIVYAPYGAKLALMSVQNNVPTLVNGFVKLPGGARAVYNSTGLAYFRHSDHLGSSRLATKPNRSLYFDVAYAPYGEDYNNYGTTDLAFTDQNQDSVSGGWTNNLYDFLMREYRTGHGRWTSPDPAGVSSVDPGTPQTWNRYAYVAGNPLLFTDALGLQLMYCDTGGGGGFYFDSEDADGVSACGDAGGSSENADVNTVVTVNGNTNSVEEISWISLNPVVPQDNSYGDCVKRGGDYFSLANGLNYLTGGRTDHGVAGHLNQAFLGNTVSDLIGLYQGESSSVQNIALEKGLPKVASAGAALIPDIASTTTSISNLSVSTGTVSVSVTAMQTTTSVLPLGTMAQSATNLLTEGLEVFTTAVKLPIDLSTSYFSAMVCGMGR